MWPFKSRGNSTEWRKFEDGTAKRVLKDFPDHHCATQKVSRSTGRRPDLFLRSKANGQRTIVEFKYSLNPNGAHLKQVSRYKGYPFFAQRAILVYPRDASV